MIGDATVSSTMCSVAPAKKTATDAKCGQPSSLMTDRVTNPLATQNNGQCVM